MCKEISLSQLGPRARREVEYVSRTTGLSIVDGGVHEGQEIISPTKARRTKIKVVSAPRRTEVLLVLTGRFSKANRSRTSHVKKAQRKTS